jgi:hypothetical protein
MEVVMKIHGFCDTKRVLTDVSGEQIVLPFRV